MSTEAQARITINRLVEDHFVDVTAMIKIGFNWICFLIRLPIHPNSELVRLETGQAAGQVTELDTEPDTELAEDWEVGV